MGLPLMSRIIPRIVSGRDSRISNGWVSERAMHATPRGAKPGAAAHNLSGDDCKNAWQLN